MTRTIRQKEEVPEFVSQSTMVDFRLVNILTAA